MRELAYGALKLTEKQRQCLEYVEQGENPWSFRRSTKDSLARHGLIEHTSLGWRITQGGRDWLEVRNRNKP